MKTDRNAELEKIRSEADALAAMPTASWCAITGRITASIIDATDAATHPDTHEEKRAGWCGRARGLKDLWEELNDLRSGAWRKWPEFSQEPKTDDSDE